MVCSPIPLSFPSTVYPRQCLFFLIIHPKTHSSNSFRAQKLKISCCQQTIQVDNQTQQKSIPIKKKRKPRPSFVEQIQDKWSLKTPSLRANFPWQEEEERSVDTNQEVQFSKVVSSQTVSEKNNSVSDIVSSNVKIKSNLAPWVHGNETRKKHFTSEKTKVKVHKEEVVLDDMHEEKRGEFDDVPFELIDEKERLVDEDSKVSSFLGNRAVISRDISIMDRSVDERLPWEEEVDKGFRKGKSNTELAERLLPESELKRLRNSALVIVEKMKVGAAGVTQELVDAIHEKWRDEEVVKLKFEGTLSKNMKRAHELLERRTGGLVIYRSGGLVVLYRGMTYNLDCVKSYSKIIQCDTAGDSAHQKRVTKSSKMVSSNYMDDQSEEEQMDLNELNLLLDELGPRFMDWLGREPLPIDADLLPAIVPEYKPPFRLLPYETKQSLRDREMTYLRRTARIMPPHFALGRNRELQGLARAIVKLWEKSAIAKIAIKRGVLNTSNERMAEELKILTGGTLLSRNKEYIVFYRGNDFLPPGLSSTLIETEKSIALKQDEEEQARLRAAALIDPNVKTNKKPLVAGTLAETVAATSRWGNEPNSVEMEKMMRENAVAKHAFLVNSLKRKLALAKGKIGLAEKALRKLHENRDPADMPVDLETLSDEERFLFRKIGLGMKPYLLLGRREVFDGTIENMHLHWKYRELVKIIIERKTFSQVRHIAVSLEAESGGVLVSIEKTPKGHVIIVYRGKNYQRPNAFRPKNLLTKRQALARSIELQRREALKHHVLELEEKIEKLKEELEDLEAANEKEQKTRTEG